MPLIAQAGEEVRDSAGTLIGTITRDIEHGERMEPEQFLLPDGSHPRHGQVIHPAIMELVWRRNRELDVLA